MRPPDAHNSREIEPSPNGDRPSATVPYCPCTTCDNTTAGTVVTPNFPPHPPKQSRLFARLPAASRAQTARHYCVNDLDKKTNLLAHSSAAPSTSNRHKTNTHAAQTRTGLLQVAGLSFHLAPDTTKVPRCWSVCLCDRYRLSDGQQIKPGLLDEVSETLAMLTFTHTHRSVKSTAV